MIDTQLSYFPLRMKKVTVPAEVLHEAARRVTDAVGCYYGAYDAKPVALLRRLIRSESRGPNAVWGADFTASADAAAWANGAGVRALDYNDTYLSKEPCHPSDLLASLWAACEESRRANQGRLLLRAMALSYEVLCRLCDAASLRSRGWDHVTYLPAASAVGCSYIFNLAPEKTRHAIALALTGSVALRQTRVGEISDWKAACAAHAARAGLWASRLAGLGFTGPNEIFSGRHGFFANVSGPFSISSKLGGRWKILETHTKYFPAEHHAQSAIEAALAIRRRAGRRRVSRVTIESFDAAVDIIGSEREKWRPTTRETADHSMPYLVVAALLDGDVTLRQFARRRFLDGDVRKLLRRVTVKRSSRLTRMYPAKLPNRVTVQFSTGDRDSAEVPLPRGYAGNPMTDGEIGDKFHRLAGPVLGQDRSHRLRGRLLNIGAVDRLSLLRSVMRVPERGTA